MGTASELTLPAPNREVASGHPCVYSKRPTLGKYIGQDGEKCIGGTGFLPFTFAGGSMKCAVFKPSSACRGEEKSVLDLRGIRSGTAELPHLLGALAFAHSY